MRYPGSVAAAAQLDLSYLSPSKGGKKSTMNSTINSARSLGSAALSSVAPSTTAGVPVLDSLSLREDGAGGVQQTMLDGMEPLSLDELSQDRDEALQEEESDWGGSELGLPVEDDRSGEQEGSEEEGGDKGLSEGAAEEQTDAEDGDALTDDQPSAKGTPLEIATSVSQVASQASTARRPGKRPAPRLNLDAIVTYLASGSTLGSLFQACLHAEHERAFHETMAHYRARSAEGSAEESPCDVLQGALLHPDLDLAYLFPGTAETDTAAFPDSPAAAEAPSSPIPQTHQVSADSISLAVRELQASGVAAFLSDVVLAPKRGARDSALTWSSWLAVLQLLARGIKTDFDALQGWRLANLFYALVQANSGGVL